MKIRTDFVTNSSSSSFVVSLRAELSDGIALEFESSSYSGDMDSTEASFAATDKEGKNIYSKHIYGSDYVEERSLIDLEPSTVDLLSITEAKSAEALVAAIKKPFFGVGHYEDKKKDEDEYEDEYEGEYEDEDEYLKEMRENTIAEFNQMVDNSDKIMEEHIKSVSDVNQIVVKYEFGGYGDGMAEPEGILYKLFGSGNGNKIYRTICNNDPKKAAETLKKLDCLKNVDDESIDRFIVLVNESDYTPDKYIIEVSVNQDGKLHYTIDVILDE